MAAGYNETICLDGEEMLTMAGSCYGNFEQSRHMIGRSEFVLIRWKLVRVCHIHARPDQGTERCTGMPEAGGERADAQTRARVRPSRRAMAAWLSTSPASSCRCHSWAGRRNLAALEVLRFLGGRHPL